MSFRLVHPALQVMVIAAAGAVGASGIALAEAFAGAGTPPAKCATDVFSAPGAAKTSRSFYPNPLP